MELPRFPSSSGWRALPLLGGFLRLVGGVADGAHACAYLLPCGGAESVAGIVFAPNGGLTLLRMSFAAAVLLAGLLGVAAAPVASASPYKTCKEAAHDGVFNIPKGDPNYDPGLDRDGDGVACEKKSS
jgi:Excalibur calcium-binding domain